METYLPASAAMVRLSSVASSCNKERTFVVSSRVRPSQKFLWGAALAGGAEEHEGCALLSKIAVFSVLASFLMVDAWAGIVPPRRADTRMFWKSIVVA
jgi:hypothetical protein